MRDIVERLRTEVSRNGDIGLQQEAAAEIECLRVREKRTRAALAQLLEGHDNLYMAHFGPLFPNANPHDDIAAKPARRALEGKE